MSLFDGCNPIDCALQTVEDLGLNIAKIGFFTRVWSGDKLGLGSPSDTLNLITPTPRLRKISKKHTNGQGGLDTKADLMVRMLSKTKFPLESDLSLISDDPKKEMYYYVDGSIYELIEVVENITHWDIFIKKAKTRKLFL